MYLFFLPKIDAMKNIFSFIILLFILFSCRKGDLTPAALPSDKLAQKIQGIQKLPADAEKIAFRLLSPNERYQLWTRKLDNLLQLKQVFNPGQISLIGELRQSLQSRYFEGESDAREIYAAVFVKDWEKRAKALFLPEDFFYIAYSLKDYDVSKRKNDPTALYDDEGDGNGAKNSCHCNVGSSYTCPRTVVHVGTNGVWLETIYGHCNRSGECRESSSGCGYLLLWSCNGNQCA